MGHLDSQVDSSVAYSRTAPMSSALGEVGGAYWDRLCGQLQTWTSLRSYGLGPRTND
eukprot:CAMPEP_0115189204 /NCGR_PEP_ID=MMETSP0270-20121206/11399_1 /TAXON_ID=71861 /ORGANISM="Scrippsiella trochoidea, Strain CCMP3099" /LENGTH=56 /DNA_ID=CAMNT_0002602397 /DNA_START=301 /DNA_END=471 /DNA_ORIENTATION=+